MDETVLATISTGFSDLTSMMKQVILVAMPATVSVLVLAKGARYGLRWIRGLFSNA